MALSEYEQRTLAEIETVCRAEDPEFATRLDLLAARTRHTRAKLIAQCGIWLGSFLFVIGAGMARGLVSAGTVTAGYGIALTVAGTVAWVRNRPRQTRHHRR